jgi:hypothetical protein
MIDNHNIFHYTITWYCVLCICLVLCYEDLIYLALFLLLAAWCRLPVLGRLRPVLSNQLLMLSLVRVSQEITRTPKCHACQCTAIEPFPRTERSVPGPKHTKSR